MKSTLRLFVIIFIILLTACGNDAISVNGDNENETMESAVNNDNDENNNEISDEFDESTGEGFIEDLGYVKNVGVGYNVDLGVDESNEPKVIEMGSMNLVIESLFVLEVEPEEDARDLFFEGEEKIKAIVINMSAENTDDIDVEFYPDNSILVTDTGEQIESEIGLMGNVGGEFFGKVKKEGQTWWLLNNLDENIENVKMIINPPYDTEEWEDLSEEKRIEFDIIDYKEALDKNMNVERTQ